MTLCRLTGCTVYDGVQFQGKVGKLTISNEKILFQQKEDPSAPPRTWLWKSMKKSQVVFSSSTTDIPEGMEIIKIYNHQNRAVSFLVPQSALLSLQDDIDCKIASRNRKTTDVNIGSAQEEEDSGHSISNNSLVASAPAISEEKTKELVARVESIKAARRDNNPHRPSQMTKSLGALSPSSAAAIECPPLRKTKSFDETTHTKTSSEVVTAEATEEAPTSKKEDKKNEAEEVTATTAKPRVKRANRNNGTNKTGSSSSSNEPPLRRVKSNAGDRKKGKPQDAPFRRTKSNGSQDTIKRDNDRSASPTPPRTKKGINPRGRSTSPTKTSNNKERSVSPTSPNSNKGGKVTIGRAATVIAQDVFLKPGKQAVHDYVVRPTNNLIVKPTNRNIIQPANRNIIQPANRNIIQPANRNIIQPANRNILQPAKEKIVDPAAQKIAATLPAAPFRRTRSNDGVEDPIQRRNRDTQQTSTNSTTTKKKIVNALTPAPFRRTRTTEDHQTTKEKAQQASTKNGSLDRGGSAHNSSSKKNNNSGSGGLDRGSGHGTKKPLLHFLKKPERRTFSFDDDLPNPPKNQVVDVNLVATSSA